MRVGCGGCSSEVEELTTLALGLRRLATRFGSGSHAGGRRQKSTTEATISEMPMRAIAGVVPPCASVCLSFGYAPPEADERHKSRRPGSGCAATGSRRLQSGRPHYEYQGSRGGRMAARQGGTGQGGKGEGPSTYSAGRVRTQLALSDAKSQSRRCQTRACLHVYMFTYLRGTCAT